MNQVDKILTIAALQKRLRHFLQLLLIDKAFAIGDLFDTGDLDALPLFDDLYELRGLHEGVEGTGVQPGGAPGQDGYFQFALFEIFLVYVGDLIFSTGRRLQVPGYAYNLIVVEIE